jgi:predicted CopG family antitoxin
MRKITISIDDEIYLSLRQKAAERNISLSQLIADYLQALGKEMRAERAKLLEQLFESADRGPRRNPVGRLNREDIYGCD